MQAAWSVLVDLVGDFILAMVFARNAPVLSTPEAMAASDWVHKVKIGPLLIVVHNEIRLRHTITLYSIPSNENQSMITSCGYTRNPELR